VTAAANLTEERSYPYVKMRAPHISIKCHNQIIDILVVLVYVDKGYTAIRSIIPYFRRS
jgi:hypothetical protein